MASTTPPPAVLPGWQDKWPSAEGMWWFYGKRFGDGGSPRLYFVEAFGSGNGLLTLVGSGHFWYEGEGHSGKWQRVVQPALPPP